MKKISIDPITRLEGHGKIDIFLDDKGDVANCYFIVPELRGFEKFCEGIPVEELPRITTRLCGVCPSAHHLAATKAVDNVYHVDPPSTAKKLRELFYAAHYIHSHIAHFYALAAPDFVLGPEAPAAERNILGIVNKVGVEIGGQVIQARKFGQEMQRIISGRQTHMVWGVPGGVTKGITKEEKQEIIKMAESCVEFSKFSLKLFEDIVLKNKTYLDIILSDIYVLKTYFIGLVDDNNKVNFYDGMARVIGPDGKELHKYDPQKDYLEYIAEHVEEYSYLKYPYLKKIGWKGFEEGPESGVYQATPLSRLNVSDGMATPLAQAEYEKMYETLGGKPAFPSLATHWARLVELLYAAERAVELAKDDEIDSPNIRTLPTEKPTEGIGVVEAPRGILTHHYKTDEKGITLKANLIVGTTNNNAPISMSIKKAAQKLIKGGEVREGLLNMVEMAFRLYDPCFSCATHSLPGQMPLEVSVFDCEKKLVRKEKR